VRRSCIASIVHRDVVTPAMRERIAERIAVPSNEQMGRSSAR